LIVVRAGLYGGDKADHESVIAGDSTVALAVAGVIATTRSVAGIS
jgi:hypothetical protein